MVPTESLTNRVWLEWIITLKARLIFRYEISDLFVRPPTESCHSTHVGPLMPANEGAVAEASEASEATCICKGVYAK